MLKRSFGNKPLFGVSDELYMNILKGLGTFSVSTKQFMEQVKIIYKQNGFVASGLSTQIKVAMKPVDFSINM